MSEEEFKTACVKRMQTIYDDLAKTKTADKAFGIVVPAIRREQNAAILDWTKSWNPEI